MENQAKSFTVLMLPWLAHGHVSPYLELAKKLIARNFIIYLCSTHANLASVRSKLDESFSQSIKLVELHLPESDELPPHYHTTNGLPANLMSTLKDAFEKGCPNFCRILKNLKPDLVIYDLLQPWAPISAAFYNIPAVEYITNGIAMTALGYHSLVSPGTKFPFESTIFCRDYESDFAKRLLVHDKDTRRVMQCMQRSNDIVLVKSFKEIEGKYGDYLSTLVGKQIVPVGHLVQDPVFNDDDQDCEVMEWLNEKEKGSTIFVSFGSEYFLSTKDMVEIAHGLEMSKVYFIWVVRFPKGENISLEEILPEGFFTNLEGREIGIGIEVLRDSSANLHKDTIAKVINQVVKGIDGEKVRNKARELSEKIGSKGENEELDEVVKKLVKLCLLKNKKIYPLPNEEQDLSKDD
ncbi:OLC1v1021458C1 [Oldenlandia corymbosa var. corymbosa]|uniref:OLC1v1021458C1 n=1 Tax=Oldenlandia corymbosa var. corymbosa TaxID=529605 RepID=A0AAV1BVQ4_OLDCO|nr:OLC1v1021458C1 [Oldenlandia corymbosa var. corymbosa]